MTLRVTVGVAHFKVGGSQNVFKILSALFVESSTFPMNFTISSQRACRVLTTHVATGPRQL
jgi:hypothetical protein